MWHLRLEHMGASLTILFPPFRFRPVEQQIEYVSVLLTNLLKTKKPIVLATTKNEEAVDSYVKDVERILAKSKVRIANGCVFKSAGVWPSLCRVLSFILMP